MNVSPFKSDGLDESALAAHVAELRCIVEGRDARVVGLGEPNHGTREVALWRYNVVAAGIKQGWVSRVLFEAPADSWDPINDFVCGRAPWSDSLLLDNGFWVWRTFETREFLWWLRRHNESERKCVEVAGVDAQRPRMSAAEVRSELEGMGMRVDSALLDWLGDVVVGSPAPKERAIIQEALESMANALPANRQTGVTRLKQALSLCGAGQRAGVLARERLMTEAALRNVETSPDGCIALLGHNAHISVGTYGGGEVVSMGAALRGELGGKYVNVGSCVCAGSFLAYRTGFLGRQSQDPVGVRIPEPSAGQVEVYFMDEFKNGRVSAGPLWLRLPLGTGSEKWRYIREAGSIVDRRTWRFSLTPIDVDASFDALVGIADGTPAIGLRHSPECASSAR